jgi:hypothetical protein
MFDGNLSNAQARNAEEFAASLPWCLAELTEPALIAEGPIDAIPLGNGGIVTIHLECVKTCAFRRRSL